MRTLAAIYAEIPDVKCKGLCVEACGPIVCFEAEAQVIRTAHGSTPHFLPNLTCDKLVGGRCSIYAERPILCRLFGVVEAMRCPFGCTPKHFLSEKRSRELMRETQELYQPERKPTP